MLGIAPKSAFRALLIGLGAAAMMPALVGAAETPLARGAAAAKSDLDRLSEAEIRALQDALLWTGDYVGTVSGTLGSRTRDAVAAYLARTGSSATASFNAAARARLLADAKARRQAVGFGPVRDKRSGVALSLPTKLLPKQTGTDSGTRFASTDGQMVVDTLSRPAAAGALPDIFTRMSSTAGSRRITYKLMRPDFFVVSGEVGDHAFYSRFAQGKADAVDLVRGFTISYPKAMSARFDPVALAVAASFDAFPAAAGPASLPQAAQPPSVPAAAAPTFADAVLVAPDVALSRLSRATCADPKVDGTAVSFRTEDQGTGLALLNVPRRPDAPASVSLAPNTPGITLLALFRGTPLDPQGSATPLLAGPAEVTRGSEPKSTALMVSAPLQGGAAFLFDRSGALAGITETPDRTPPAIAGTIPEADYRVTGARAIGAFLDNAGIGRAAGTVPADLGFGERAAALRPSIISVTCEPRPAPVP